MPEVFVCPPKAISAESRKSLEAVGVVVVEAANPEQCRFLRSAATVGADDLLWAAMSALQASPDSGGGREQRDAFIAKVGGLVDAARKRR